MLPSEFRIFRKGWNKTSKGSFLFDEQAARLVMADYEQHGVDLMIDLEHLSIDPDSPSFDPDACGWFNLAVKNGELWAVNVRWNEEGARRLNGRLQRYFSPAFSANPKTRRIEDLYNVAICAVPATYDAPALVAASKRSGKPLATLSIEVKMSPELLKIAQALGLDEKASLEDILAALKALQEEQTNADEDKPEEEAADDDKPEEEASDKDDDDDKEKMSHLSKLPPKLQAEVLAALHGHKSLKGEIAEIRASQRKSEVEKLIAANTDKIPLKLEGWARKQSPDTLREFLKHAEVKPRGSEPPPRGGEHKREDSTEGAEVTLTDEDRKVIKLTGGDAKKFLEKKKELAQKDREARAARGE
jgi:hypothetical protein